MHFAFLGAADAATVSRHRVDVGGTRILLDCGRFPGDKTLRERNWAQFPYDLSTMEAVVPSHAHLHHSGFLPAPVKGGFEGRIHASATTCDLREVGLLDSAQRQEEDARRASPVGSSRHAPALPL